MADQTENAAPAADPVVNTPDAAPVAAPETAPVTDTAAAAPETGAASTDAGFEPSLLTQTKAPGTEETPAADPAAPAAEKPADPAAEAAKSEGDKPADPAKPEGDKPAEAAAAEKPADGEQPPKAELPPIEYKYELPETLSLTDEMRAEVHTAFDQFRADPTNPQPLIDFHNKAMQAHDERVRQEQWDTYSETVKGWKKAVMADPILGGAGHHTSMQAIARMRDRFASSHAPGTPEYAADLRAFDGFVDATGAGSHPIFLRLLHNIAQVYDEPGLGPTDIKPAAQSKRGGKVLYDNPTSPGNGRSN